MPSPFPGMDPYLTLSWRDVHTRLIVYACDAIQESLPAILSARLEENVLLETPQGLSEHPYAPDVRVVEYPAKQGQVAATPSGVALADPVVIDLAEAVVTEQVTEPRLEIIDRGSGNRVVTVLELLSPTNKTSRTNRTQYQRKQVEILESNANLVEVDFIHFGPHILACPIEAFSERPTYLACVRRATKPLQAEVYPIRISDRLPTLRIPLRPDDADVPLDLQALLELSYRKGGYGNTIDYTRPLDPPLRGPDAAWAEQRLTEGGFRTPKKPRRRKGQ